MGADGEGTHDRFEAHLREVIELKIASIAAVWWRRYTGTDWVEQSG